MPIEAWKYSEKEKKHKISAEEKQKLLKKEAFQKEERQKASIKESSDNALSHLKEIIAHHDIDSEILEKVENISSDGILDTDEIHEILNTIWEMQDSIDMQEYLPRDLIITKDEFIHALSDDAIKQKVLSKLDNALGMIYQHVDGWNSALGMIGMVALVLDKNLVTLQENHIDIQDVLLQDNTHKESWLFTQLKEVFLRK